MVARFWFSWWQILKCGLRLYIKFNRWDTRSYGSIFSGISLVLTYICRSLSPTFSEIWVKFISFGNKMVDMTHIYLHTKYWVSVSHFLWNICQNMLPGEPPGPNGPIFLNGPSFDQKWPNIKWIWHFRHLSVTLTYISRFRSVWPTFMKI